MAFWYPPRVPSDSFDDMFKWEACLWSPQCNSKLVHSEPVAPYFDDAAKAEWEDIKSYMLSDHYMMWFDHRMRLYRRAEFSAISFGYAATQPGDDT